MNFQIRRVDWPLTAQEEARRIRVKAIDRYLDRSIDEHEEDRDRIIRRNEGPR